MKNAVAENARVLLADWKHDEEGAKTHSDRNDLIGHNLPAGPESPLTQNTVERLSRKGVTSVPNRIHKGPNLNRSLQQKVLSGRLSYPWKEEERIRSSPPPQREEFLPQRSFSRLVSKCLPEGVCQLHPMRDDQRRKARGYLGHLQGRLSEAPSREDPAQALTKGLEFEGRMNRHTQTIAAPLPDRSGTIQLSVEHPKGNLCRCRNRAGLHIDRLTRNTSPCPYSTHTAFVL